MINFMRLNIFHFLGIFTTTKTTSDEKALCFSTLLVLACWFVLKLIYLSPQNKKLENRCGSNSSLRIFTFL